MYSGDCQALKSSLDLSGRLQIFKESGNTHFETHNYSAAKNDIAIFVKLLHLGG